MTATSDSQPLTSCPLTSQFLRSLFGGFSVRHSLDCLRFFSRSFCSLFVSQLFYFLFHFRFNLLISLVFILLTFAINKSEMSLEFLIAFKIFTSNAIVTDFPHCKSAVPLYFLSYRQHNPCQTTYTVKVAMSNLYGLGRIKFQFHRYLSKSVPYMPTFYSFVPKTNIDTPIVHFLQVC